MPAVFYEFEINRKNIEHIVEDLQGVSRSSQKFGEAVDTYMDLIRRNDPRMYKVIEINSKPGLRLRLSRFLEAERLPHTIEGLHAFIHPSSEGHLTLEEFKEFFEALLALRGIPYKRYDSQTTY